MNQFNVRFILDPAIGKRLRVVLMGLVSVATVILAILEQLEANQWAVTLPFIVWVIQYVANYTSIGNAPELPVYGPPAPPERTTPRASEFPVPDALRPRDDAE